MGKVEKNNSQIKISSLNIHKQKKNQNLITKILLQTLSSIYLI